MGQDQVVELKSRLANAAFLAQACEALAEQDRGSRIDRGRMLAAFAMIHREMVGARHVVGDAFDGDTFEVDPFAGADLIVAAARAHLEWNSAGTELNSEAVLPPLRLLSDELPVTHHRKHRLRRTPNHGRLDTLANEFSSQAASPVARARSRLIRRHSRTRSPLPEWWVGVDRSTLSRSA